MNYYEELGIPRNATTAEVREAYKLAARLLHPDMQQDQRLKDLAECQMRRLSGVLTMLVNPRERARYDAGLANEARFGPFPRPAAGGGSNLWQTAARHWFWVLLASMTVGMGVWRGLAHSTDVPPQIAAERNAKAATDPPVAQAEPEPMKSRRVKTAKTDTRSVRQNLPLRNTAREETELIMVTTAPTPLPQAEVPKAEGTAGPVAEEALPADAARGSDEPGFAGQWLYAPDAAMPDPAGMYPAKYVEFRLHEDHGYLAGDYRAVHSRVDKVISPEVIFHVRGELPQGKTGMLAWESKAGAKGELELTLQAPNRLVVKWWTTQFGRLEVLSSGMAVLMRLRNP